MTRKERAISNLKQMCSDGRYLGSGSYAPLEVLQDFNLAIKALEQESILDEIRAKIAELDNKVCQQFLIEDVDKEVHHAYKDCLDIIDKYKAESERTWKKQ